MKKVLIVEDDLIVANVYRNKLVHEGYRVETAADGEAGLSMVRSFLPDVVLLDLMLPKVSGLDLMKQIRAEPEFSKLPFIVFSSTYLTNVVQDAWKAGATKCLSKTNCTPKEVVEVVRDSLGATAPSAPPRQTAPVAPTSAHDRGISPKQTGSSDPDEEFQKDLRRSFISELPATLASLRTGLQGLSKAAQPSERLPRIHELLRRVHALTGNAAVCGMAHIGRTADAFEALLKELHDKPGNINVSTLRTVASAIDFLAFLFQRAAGPVPDLPPAKVLVVDDEAISRRAVTYALGKAQLKSVNEEDPERALQLLSQGPFDLVFLDVDMPNMNGYELCSKLRALPMHKKTPVIFVTGLNDFESRANSTMSGGNDFIAKPFLFTELAVKALVCVLRGQLSSGR